MVKREKKRSSNMNGIYQQCHLVVFLYTIGQHIFF